MTTGNSRLYYADKKPRKRLKSQGGKSHGKRDHKQPIKKQENVLHEKMEKQLAVAEERAINNKIKKNISLDSQKVTLNFKIRSNIYLIPLFYYNKI